MLPPHSHSETSVDRASSWSRTLPRTWRETKLVTKVKEGDGDDAVLRERQQLVATVRPAELAAIRGISDFPVPTLFKRRARSSSESKDKATKRK